MPQRGVKGSLPFITISDADQVVGVAQVQFREDCGTMERLECRVNERQTVLVFSGYVKNVHKNQYRVLKSYPFSPRRKKQLLVEMKRVG